MKYQNYIITKNILGDSVGTLIFKTLSMLMNENVDEYLRIIYPNFERLSEEERLQFEKDKAFLLAYRNPK